MITWSSNLATNILIETADPQRIETMLADLGADSMRVLRGVEDLKAFQAGMSNSTTARGLGTVMAAVAQSEIFTDESRRVMLDILERQHFRDGIPAGVPEGVRVANKTGWITAINHDAAIVFPDSAAPYVLVVMVRGHPAEDQGEAMTAELSRIVWRWHIDRSM
jgi:beta-lactamase class A